MNGTRINSCLSLAVMHAGDRVATIEGLGTPDRLHPLLEEDGGRDEACALLAGCCAKFRADEAFGELKEAWRRLRALRARGGGEIAYALAAD